jgi:hypothetical protein
MFQQLIPKHELLNRYLQYKGLIILLLQFNFLCYFEQILSKKYKPFRGLYNKCLYFQRYLKIVNELELWLLHGLLDYEELFNS